MWMESQQWQAGKTVHSSKIKGQRKTRDFETLISEELPANVSQIDIWSRLHPKSSITLQSVNHPNTKKYACRLHELDFCLQRTFRWILVLADILIISFELVSFMISTSLLSLLASRLGELTTRLFAPFKAKSPILWSIPIIPHSRTCTIKAYFSAFLQSHKNHSVVKSPKHQVFYWILYMEKRKV